MSRALLLSAASAAFVVAATGEVTIATFDGASATTRPWEVVNDPVMGGQSRSSFEVDGARGLGIWHGQVAIVPFLKAPGFCNLQSPGLYKTATFPDLSGEDGIFARLREATSSGLTRFNIMLTTKGARHFMKKGVYTANIVLTGEMEDHLVPWSSFYCSWRGQNVSWCPDLATQLNAIDSIGVGTAFPGEAGDFQVEIESLAAGASPGSKSNSNAIQGAAPAFINLATFDGRAPHMWHSENDPVMGGQSSSSFSVVSTQDGSKVGDYRGSCRIVPKLGAPGFTIAMTETPVVGRFADVSSMDGLELGVRLAGGNVTSFKVAFCDSRINYYRCQFQSFKADFSVPVGPTFSSVFLPWTSFSDKWSAYTGEHTAESPPKRSSLQSITQLQIWTEGVFGDFHLQISHVRAAKASVSTLFI